MEQNNGTRLNKRLKREEKNANQPKMYETALPAYLYKQIYKRKAYK